MDMQFVNKIARTLLAMAFAAVSSVGIATSQETAPQEVPVGQEYIVDIYGDWTLRCLRAQDGNDPCMIFQLLLSDDGVPVVELGFFPITQRSNGVIAIARLIAPLQTYLPRGVMMGIDGQEVARYPYDFCDQAGCLSRIGLTQELMTSLEAASIVNVTIAAAQAPSRGVELEASLEGFSEGMAALSP